MEFTGLCYSIMQLKILKSHCLFKFELQEDEFSFGYIANYGSLKGELPQGFLSAQNPLV